VPRLDQLTVNKTFGARTSTFYANERVQLKPPSWLRQQPAAAAAASATEAATRAKAYRPPSSQEFDSSDFSDPSRMQVDLRQKLARLRMQSEQVNK
jgi:hypothetical protein